MRLPACMAAHRGQPVAGVILATDGRSNTGEDPLNTVEAAARQHIPVFSIAAGGDEGPRNIRLAEIEVSPVVFVRDPMTLGVVVEARGLKDAEATIVLEQRVNDGAWEGLGSQRVVLGEDGAFKRAVVPAHAAGDRSVRIPRQGRRRRPRAHTGRQCGHRRRESRPPEDPRLARSPARPRPRCSSCAMRSMRDQHVEFAGWIQHADPGFRQPGDRPIQRLPANDSELRQYDALLMVDPDLRTLGPHWPEMITHFVGQEGGGLIFVAGELYSQQLFESADSKAPGGDWTRILPVVRDAGLYRSEAEVRLSSQNTYTLELTPEGRGDPVFEFHPDPIKNRAILNSLPGMYWSFPVTRARPARPCWHATAIRAWRTSTDATCSWLRSSMVRAAQHSSASTVPIAGAISPKTTSTVSGRAWSIAWDGTRRSAAGSRSRFFWVREAIASATGYQSGRPLHRSGRPGRGRRADGRARDRRPAAGAVAVRKGARRSRDVDGHRSGAAGGRVHAEDRPGGHGRPGLGSAGVDHDVPGRAAQARDRRALAQSAPPDRARPAHERAGL